MTTDLKEASATTDMSSSTAGSYPGWDRFNRTIANTWVKDGGGPTFYSVNIDYDRDSNITDTVDNIHHTDTPLNSGIRNYDAGYTMDSLNRLTDCLEGSWNGSSITSQSRGEKWKTSGGALALSQTGNWGTYRLATSGSSYADESRSFNVANEITAIAGSTPVYDANGNLTSEDNWGNGYRYVYDAFNRMRKINAKSGALVAEYTYNGLGYRIGWHYDVTKSGGGPPDGVVDANDPWYYFCYNERWRMVATFRSTDSKPKEQFYNHAAGLGGYGGSSYIDSVILRDRDADTAWDVACDGTLEERNYYCQNWRADVSAIITAAGSMVQWVKCSPYGTPIGICARSRRASSICLAIVAGAGADACERVARFVGLLGQEGVRQCSPWCLPRQSSLNLSRQLRRRGPPPR